MQNPLTAFRRWWNRPSAKQRILDALSTTEWRRTLEIVEAADVSVARFYIVILRLEEAKLVESRFGTSELYANGARRRLYRRIG